MPDAPNVPLQNCPACGTAVNVAEAEPLARVTCPKCGEKFRVETSFDNFKLVETLGVGGMGSVYKAQDTRLGRFVALKLLRKDLSADPAEAARLEQEARVTAAINHPNVVQLYSSGTAHGQIYLVMELVDHGSLDDLMAQHTRVPERQVLETGIQVAKGLQAAHEKGLIHRDVKPANILFSDARTAKIGDFGLAGAAEQHAEAQKEIWGTPYYVAPERLDNAPEDFRSDIYSLGATLFHALAGRPPMEGETTSAAELRRLKSAPPPLRSVAPDVSKETARVIDRMIAPDPANRFTSYSHLVDQLTGAWRALPSDGASGGAETPSRLRPVLIAVVLLALLGGGGLYWWQARKAATAVVTAPTPTPTPDNSAALQKNYEDARRQLLDGKLDAAAAGFAKLAKESQNRRPLQSWAWLHAGLTAMLQGKMSQARDAFEQLGRIDPSTNPVSLAGFFSEMAKTLAAPGPIRGAAEADGKGVNAFALFLHGVKDWQLREFDEAAAFLKRFTETAPPNDYKWIAEYQPLARQYLEDYAVYTEAKALPQRLPTAAVAQSTVEKIHELQSRVKTAGPLRDALKEEETRLNASASKLQQEETRAREQRDAEEFERRKPTWLTEWKVKLIGDLKTGRFKSPVTLGPTTYQGVATADGSEITMRIAPYGGARFKWDKFPPAVLLSMSAAFIQPGAPDAAERQWLAAIYAQSTGQLDAAKTLGEAAAKAKPEYEKDLRFLRPAEAGSH